MLKSVSRFAWLALACAACSKPAQEPEQKRAIVLPPGSETASAAPSTQAIATCGLASTTEVSNTLGITGLGEPQVAQQGNVTVCHYGDAANPQRVLIRFETGRSASELDRTKQMFEQSGQPITLVPGLGDAALSMTSETGGSSHSMTLAFKGSQTIQVAAPTSADKVQALVRQIVGKL